MASKIFLLGLYLLAVCHGKTINTTPADPQPATPEDVYKPPTFDLTNNSRTSEHPIRSTTKKHMRPSGFAQVEEDLFLRTAMKWFNVHLGTLATNLPARNNSVPILGWHIAIYSKGETTYEQICGGSLVTKDVVISAAHCFWDDGGLIPAEQFAVAGGKLHRAWHELQIHQSNVSEIIVKSRFLGIKTHFQDDIAILRLEKGFSYDYGVKPLCVNFDVALERRQLRNGNLGIILGFGLTEENGEPSDRLNYQNLPYVEIEDCIQASDPDFIKYLTSDKICAGDQKSGRAICQGDSGGGLVFFVGDQNTTTSIPFLRGIASTAPRNENKCNAFAIGTYTDVNTHRTFLRDNIPGLEEECEKVYKKELIEIVKKLNSSTNSNNRDDNNYTQNINDITTVPSLSEIGRSAVLIGFQPSLEADTTVNTLKPNVIQRVNEAIPDNSLPDSDSDAMRDDIENEDKQDPDYIRTLLKPAPAVGESSAPAYHWHVAVYTKKTTPYLQICGGTLVKTNVIISAAHCFHDQARVQSPEMFAAAVGKLHRPWGDPRDEYAQYSDIKQIHIPENFVTITNSLRSCYQHDVAVLNLAAPFVYAPGVRAACVDFTTELNRDHLAPGSFGKFPGWSNPDNECEPAQRLSSRYLPFVSLDGCLPDSPLSFTPGEPSDPCSLVDIALSDDRVPAYVRVPSPCYTDSGGGLTYLMNSTNVPYLQAVATADPGVPKCDIFIMDSFTELRTVQEFLQAVVPGLEEECDVAYPVKSVGVETEATGGETNVQRAGDTNENQPSLINNERHKPTEFNNDYLNTESNRNIPSPDDAGPASANSNRVKPSHRQNPLEVNQNFNNIRIANFDDIPLTNASVDRSKFNSKPVFVWRKRNQTMEKAVNDSYPVVGSMAVPILGSSSWPSFQWHVGVYSKAWTPYLQICGGSLVKRDVVLSAAHCFWSDEFGPQAPAQFATAAGKRHRPWTDPRDAGAQYSHVRELIFPDRFVGIKTNLQDDIAVVRLTTPFEYNAGVQPICVDFSLETERHQLRKGRSGILAGWGLTENDDRWSQQLNYIELPYMEVKECIKHSEPAFLKYITSDKICAGDKETRRYICRSDAGGGLVFIDTHPTIRGISSQVFAGLCEAITLSPQTLISSHAIFLRDNVLDIERECLDFYGPSNVGRNIGGYGGLSNANLHLSCNCNCDTSGHRP